MQSKEFIIENLKQLGPQLYVPHPNKLTENTLKPKAKLWTSTAVKKSKGYTSDWVEWASSAMPDWIGPVGYLFTVDPSVKILNINSDRDAVKVAKMYGVNITEVTQLFSKMPWDKIAHDYDGIHHIPTGRDLFMSSWDVESTAWFNLQVLHGQGEVPIAQKFVSRIISTLKKR
jgi:hypothetical protein